MKKITFSDIGSEQPTPAQAVCDHEMQILPADDAKSAMIRRAMGEQITIYSTYAEALAALKGIDNFETQKIIMRYDGFVVITR